MTRTAEAAPDPGVPPKKPRLALAIATALGAGYAPNAPGTFGSVVGLIMACFFALLEIQIMVWMSRGLLPGWRNQPPATVPFALLPALVTVLLAVMGVWSSSRVAEYSGAHDPQYVVIDEVSGQHLALLLGLLPLFAPAAASTAPGYSGKEIELLHRLLNWKYLLAGFILFRVFDIWKPWPVRQLEKLPKGWGIMADDWMAGIYAAILLRLAIHFSVI